MSVLVDEWSRSYTVEALKGDVESMCMLAQGHFSRNGWGCIPHDMQRGHDWLARAKQAIIDAAAVEAKRFGRKPCMMATSAKATELEEQCLQENILELECAPEATLDDHMSSGSIASLGSFSCDAEGGDTQGSFLESLSVQVPLEESYAAIESDGSNSYSIYSSAPPSQRGSVRNSLSHPDLNSAFTKGWNSTALHSVRPTASSHLPSSVLYEHEDGECEVTAAEQESVAAATPNTNTDASCEEVSIDQWCMDASHCATAPGSSAGSQQESEADSPQQAHVPMMLHASQAQIEKDFCYLQPISLRRALSATN